MLMVELLIGLVTVWVLWIIFVDKPRQKREETEKAAKREAKAAANLEQRRREDEARRAQYYSDAGIREEAMRYIDGNYSIEGMRDVRPGYEKAVQERRIEQHDGTSVTAEEAPDLFASFERDLKVWAVVEDELRRRQGEPCAEEATNNGVVYAYKISGQKWVKIGCTYVSARNRMLDYAREHGIEPDRKSLVELPLANKLDAAETERYVHERMQEIGYKRQRIGNALEIFSFVHADDYRKVVQDLRRVLRSRLVS
jgi:hypothetical protein